MLNISVGSVATCLAKICCLTFLSRCDCPSSLVLIKISIVIVLVAIFVTMGPKRVVGGSACCCICSCTCCTWVCRSCWYRSPPGVSGLIGVGGGPGGVRGEGGEVVIFRIVVPVCCWKVD